MVWDIINKILKLFGKQISTSDTAEKMQYAKQYQDTSNINFHAIFSNKLAGFVTTESNVDVINADKAGTPTKRVELLNNLIDELWKQSRKVTAKFLGTGGIILIPYCVGGKIYTDIISQDRFFINQMYGNKITQATVLAEIIERNSKTYYRFTDYVLENNTYYIKNRATSNDKEIQLADVTEWAGIAPEIAIGNVGKMLFAYLKCPIDKRTDNELYGVPITYGNDKLLTQITSQINYLAKEFELKQTFIGADGRLFDKDNKLPKDGLFKKLINASKNDNAMWEIFDPIIREQSLIAGLNSWFELLEKSVGTSRGILTESQTQGATATEIKRSSYDTFALIENIRDVWKYGLEDLIYAYDVFADFYNLTPKSDYKIKIDWSYALVESSEETFTQLVQGNSLGAIGNDEIRQFIKPSETAEETKAKIAEIQANEPSLRSLVGE